MYDIDYSNLLSRNIMKMYLYDLAVLGIVKNKMEKQISNKEAIRHNLGRRAEFNSAPYRYGYHYNTEYTEYMGTYVFYFVLFVVILIASVFGGARWIHWVEIVIHAFGETIGMVVLIGVLCALPMIPIYFKKKKEEQQKYMNEIEEQKARKLFEREEDVRIQKESEQIFHLDKEIKDLKEKRDVVDNLVTYLFNKDILHMDYRETEICGVLFQLFDTGRVHNLTEAMNLYEDLKWKTEVKLMLQSLIEKVEELMVIQRHIEYYSRCSINNQMETNKLLQDVSMNQRQIQGNQEAIKLNTDIIRINTDTIKLLEEFSYIQNERNQ